MRKTIFIFLIIITSFIFIDNVYGANFNYLEESRNINWKLKIKNYNDLTEYEKSNIYVTYANASSTYKHTLLECFTTMYNYWENNTNYDSYFIYYDGHNTRAYFFNKVDAYSYPFITSIDYGTSGYYTINLLQKTTKNYYSLSLSTLKVSGSSFTIKDYYTINDNSYYNYNELLSAKGQTINDITRDTLYFYTNYMNESILYSTDYFSSRVGANSSANTISYNNVYYNDELLFSNGSFAYSKTPTINFNNLIHSYNDNNEIISTSIDIILNNIDTSKHLAQYITQSNIDYAIKTNGFEEWHDIITEEDKTFTTNINDTLYVRIIDAEKYWESADKGQELVIDIIKSATYTFTNIVETLPVIQYSTRIPDMCKIIHNDTDYISCVELSMNVKNMNVNKYKLYRMEHYTDTDTYTEWSECYYTEFKNYINDNMTIFYKITDKYDNYITSASIKIEEIREFLEQGLFIEFSDKYLKNSRLVEITMKIANDNNYTYYYSTNNGLEYKVVQDITDINFNIKKGIFYTDTNGKILVKVVDSNGQVVNIFEHTINYKQLEMNNDSFVGYINSVFNFFITPITHIFSLITTFYTTLPTILQYLFSGIFILAIFYYIIKFIL